MPTYKILGIYSFADNLKEINIREPVILKHEKYNIKSKNAIGIYIKNNKKIGYLPIENNNELLNFKNSYRISKLQLNQDYPVVEINRYYPNINIIENCEFNYIKKIKYDYNLIDITNDLVNSLKNVINSLKHKRINIKKIAITHLDDNFINLSIETSKGIETFYTITYKYFMEFKDKYEELLEFNLIDHVFFKELMFHRPEKYIETSYTNILKYKFIEKHQFLKIIIYEKINKLNDNIDIIYFTKLYIYCIINNDFNYIIKYLNKFTKEKYDDIEIIKKFIENSIIINNFFETYELKLGGFYYDHNKQIYSEIDFINDDTVFIVSEEVFNNYVLNLYLTNKKNLIIYNPIEGTINKVSLV
jgi:hypothetical protein